MILFVGDKPSPRMKPGAKPFEGAACEKRFKDWAFYITDYSLLEWRVLQTCPWVVTNINISSSNINISSSNINISSSNLLIKIFNDNNRPIIALGNNASKALKDIKHFKLPHPSGRNRQVNDKAFIDQKLKECREWLKK